MSGPLLLRLAGSDDQAVEEHQAPAPAAPEHTTPVLAVKLSEDGRPVSLGEQARAAFGLAVRDGRRQLAVLSKREGTMLNGLLAGKPPSVLEQCGYSESRAWVPPGHDGGWAEKLGAIYHLVIGVPGVAVGNLISGVCARPSRFGIALVFLLAIALVIAFAA